MKIEKKNLLGLNINVILAYILNILKCALYEMKPVGKEEKEFFDVCKG